MSKVIRPEHSNAGKNNALSALDCRFLIHIRWCARQLNQGLLQHSRSVIEQKYESHMVVIPGII